ncbi:hypothetical protein [Noviherbaspirillum cavernae]|uniref:hypothetical protein n=1 Tax=Noviherbaspirillum cavernae TaxID=2320862 RepID=UPI001F5B2C76|nr:hypothetical protein [Noviherbaspirillum cavernae]
MKIFLLGKTGRLCSSNSGKFQSGKRNDPTSHCIERLSCSGQTSRQFGLNSERFMRTFCDLPGWEDSLLRLNMRSIALQ